MERLALVRRYVISLEWCGVDMHWVWGMSLPLFLLISVPARGARFVAVTLLALWLAHGPLGGLTEGSQVILAAALWSVFYVFYFRVKGI